MLRLQCVVGKELKTDPDEILRAGNLREEEPLVWSQSFRYADRFQCNPPAPVVAVSPLFAAALSMSNHSFSVTRKLITLVI